jgi:hypothetical protein
MGRITKTTSATDMSDPIRSEMDQIDRLMARLHRAAAQVGVDPAIHTAASTLAKRYAAFTSTGDADADGATLAELEQQATSLLRKAQKQQRDRS